MNSLVPYSHVLVVGTLLFAIGVLCVMTRRQLLMILIGVEIMLNGAALVFVAAALHFQNVDCSSLPWQRPKSVSAWP